MDRRRWFVVKAMCNSMASKTQAPGSFTYLAEPSARLKELKKWRCRIHGDAGGT